MTLVRLRLADLCWRATDSLLALAEVPHSVTRPCVLCIFATRLTLRLARLMLRAGKRLAPEVVQG